MGAKVKKSSRTRSTTPLKEVAYKKLENLIITDHLPAGAMLSEVDLSKQLNLGRTPVRDALQRLAREGLVVIHPQRGVMVTEMNATIQLQVLEIRRPLLHLIATCAARRATAQQRSAMLEYARLSEEAAASGDGEAFFEYTRKNQMLLEQAAHNELIQGTMSPLHARSRRFWYAHYERFGDLEKAAAAHANLLRSIVLGDEADAEKNADQLIDYLEEFCRATIAHYGRSNKPVTSSIG